MEDERKVAFEGLIDRYETFDSMLAVIRTECIDIVEYALKMADDNDKVEGMMGDILYNFGGMINDIDKVIWMSSYWKKRFEEMKGEQE